jgi:hypothetical protein
LGEQTEVHWIARGNEETGHESHWQRKARAFTGGRRNGAGGRGVSIQIHDVNPNHGPSPQRLERLGQAGVGHRHLEGVRQLIPKHLAEEAMNRKEKSVRILLDVVLLAALLVGVSAAAPVTVPNTFVNGAVADAAQVNANFTALANALNAQQNGTNALVSTIIVHPTGTAAANGTALIATLAGITGASGTTPFLVRLEPGVYDLGSQSLTMKDFVDLSGAGTGMTRVQSSAATGTLIGAANSSIRHLQIENTGGLGISFSGVSSSFTDTLADVVVYVSGASDGVGIHVADSNPFLRGVVVLNDCPGNKVGIRATSTNNGRKLNLVDVNIGTLTQRNNQGTALSLENVGADLDRFGDDWYQFSLAASSVTGTDLTILNSQLRAAVSLSGGIHATIRNSSVEDNLGATDAFAVTGSNNSVWMFHSTVAEHQGTINSAVSVSGGTNNQFQLFHSDVNACCSASQAGAAIAGAGNMLFLVQSSISNPGTAAAVSSSATAWFKHSFVEGSVVASGGTVYCVGTFSPSSTGALGGFGCQ